MGEGGQGGEGSRWSNWAGSLLSRHRRLAARTMGVSLVLAKPGTASRIVRERWLFSSRSLLPQIHLSIQPLLRFDLRTAMEAPRVLRQVVQQSERRHTDYHRLFTDRFRQSDSSSTRELVTTQRTSAAPGISPLSLVLQRLREPERNLAVLAERRAQDGPAGRPAIVRRFASKVRREEQSPISPAVRVLREEALASQSERDFGGAARTFPATADPWRETPISAPPAPSVEVLTEKVMRQIDQRLHAWRERKGGF